MGQVTVHSGRGGGGAGQGGYTVTVHSKIGTAPFTEAGTARGGGGCSAIQRAEKVCHPGPRPRERSSVEPDQSLTFA